MTAGEHRRVPATVAVAGTAGICGAAFVLSFAALCDLAARSGVTTPWLWPAIVDGLIVVATVAVVAGAGRYAWCLLAAGALVSVAGNVLHAALPDGVLPVWLRATVAAVPPIALVAVAHLAVLLRRHHQDATPEVEGCDSEQLNHAADTATDRGDEHRDYRRDEQSPDVAVDAKALGMELLRDRVSPNAVADQLGVHRTTVYRWRRELGVSV